MRLFRLLREGEALGLKLVRRGQKSSRSELVVMEEPSDWSRLGLLFCPLLWASKSATKLSSLLLTDRYGTGSCGE